MTKTRLLDQDMIESLLDHQSVNRIVDQTFAQFGRKQVKNPTKVTLDLGNNSDWPDYEGYINAMPAYIGGDIDTAGLKWVGGFDGQRKAAGYPYINGLIILVDPQMGTFEVVMDGQLITNWRTGAQTAVALKYLSFQPGQKLNLALFGTGMQASMQVQAISEWYEIDQLNLWHYHEQGVDEFIEAHQPYVTQPIQFTPDVSEACQADIIITATKSPDPLIQFEDVKENATIIPIGSGQELGLSLIHHADHLIVDHIDQALHRGALCEAANRGIIDHNDIDATIGQLSAGRTHLNDLDQGITICIPIGIGALDIAIAAELLQKAEENEIGSFFEFNPY